jgi:hypothetical protein
MNAPAARTLIAHLAVSLAELGIAVNDSRRATLGAGGCFALASFRLAATDPEGVLVGWAIADGMVLDGQQDPQQLHTATTAILNDALARLLAEMGYSTRPDMGAGGGTVVTGTQRRPGNRRSVGRQSGRQR